MFYIRNPTLPIDAYLLEEQSRLPNFILIRFETTESYVFLNRLL